MTWTPTAMAAPARARGAKLVRAMRQLRPLGQSPELLRWPLETGAACFRALWVASAACKTCRPEA